VEAAKLAITSPLLESSIEGATGILLNVSGGADMGLFEVNEAAEVIANAADIEANVIFGAVLDESLGDQMRVTVIATGFDDLHRRRAALERSMERTGEVPIAGAAESPAEQGTPRQPAEVGDLLPQTPNTFEMDDDILDIPPFLRDKQ
ncbi:MAG: cell division protein FtsZ, partial [Actinobacteria bacterium]|nr:cell division protein FtsZ [Actinomycetota bacterium]